MEARVNHLFHRKPKPVNPKSTFSRLSLYRCLSPLELSTFPPEIIFEEIARRGYMIYIRHIMRNWSISRADATDIVGDALIKLKENIDKIEKWVTVFSWLDTTVYNLGVDFFRKQKRQRTISIEASQEASADGQGVLSEVQSDLVPFTVMFEAEIYSFVSSYQDAHLKPGSNDELVFNEYFLNGKDLTEIEKSSGRHIGSLRNTRKKLREVIQILYNDLRKINWFQSYIPNLTFPAMTNKTQLAYIQSIVSNLNEPQILSDELIARFYFNKVDDKALLKNLRLRYKHDSTFIELVEDFRHYVEVEQIASYEEYKRDREDQMESINFLFDTNACARKNRGLVTEKSPDTNSHLIDRFKNLIDEGSNSRISTTDIRLRESLTDSKECVCCRHDESVFVSKLSFVNNPTCTTARFLPDVIKSNNYKGSNVRNLATSQYQNKTKQVFLLSPSDTTSAIININLASIATANKSQTEKNSCGIA